MVIITWIWWNFPFMLVIIYGTGKHNEHFYSDNSNQLTLWQWNKYSTLSLQNHVPNRQKNADLINQLICNTCSWPWDGTFTNHRHIMIIEKPNFKYPCPWETSLPHQPLQLLFGTWSTNWNPHRNSLNICLKILLTAIADWHSYMYHSHKNSRFYCTFHISSSMTRF
jgi:hypothetical protein